MYIFQEASTESDFQWFFKDNKTKKMIINILMKSEIKYSTLNKKIIAFLKRKFQEQIQRIACYKK